MRTFALLLLSICVISSWGCEAKPHATTEPTSAVSSGPVQVEIVTAKGKQVVTIQNVSAGTTVEALMRSIEDVEIVISGTGTMAFLHQIGDLETAGGEGWSYRIDGELVHLGIGAQTVDPPSTLSWSYGGVQE